MPKSVITTLYVVRNGSWYQLYTSKPTFVSSWYSVLSGRRVVEWDNEMVYDLCIDEFQITFGLKRLLITKKQEAKNYVATIKIIIPDVK